MMHPRKEVRYEYHSSNDNSNHMLNNSLHMLDSEEEIKDDSK